MPRGIFSIRECGGEATDSCSVCHRPLCQEHIVYQSTVIFCAKCLEKENAGTKDGAVAPKTSASRAVNSELAASELDPKDWKSPGWSQRWRDNYHSTYHYYPVMFYYDGYYDDFDRNSFDQRAEADFGDGGQDVAGFSDS
jgi:hypothetical protein